MTGLDELTSDAIAAAHSLMRARPALLGAVDADNRPALAEAIDILVSDALDSAEEMVSGYFGQLRRMSEVER